MKIAKTKSFMGVHSQQEKINDNKLIFVQIIPKKDRK